MAVTQYIGARYVPLFADPIDWSNQNTYEPLTIVLHEGNSYTSKQAVPKGIDISNEDFWALTGNYNAQIELYRRDTSAVREELDDIAAVIPDDAFDSTNTVKQYVDNGISNLETSIGEIADVLPSDAFTAEHTVNQAIDELSNLLPSEYFTETETVKSYIDELKRVEPQKLQLVFSGVLENISKTSFQLFKIPLAEPIEQISKRTFASSFVSWHSTLSDYSHPVLFVNGPLDGIEINNGNILLNETNGNYWTCFGVKNGAPSYIVQSPTGVRKTATEMIFEGWTFVACGFACFIENGTPTDLSVYQDCYNYSTYLTSRVERAAIGWDANYWYVFVCPGRRPFNNGFTKDELISVFQHFNIPNGVDMDGGGSVQCYLNNPVFEVTQVSDTNINNEETSLTTRNVPFMISFGGLQND